MAHLLRRPPPVPIAGNNDNFRQAAVLNRLTNPPLGSAIDALRYLGPFFTARFAAEVPPINTLLQLRTRLANQTQAQNQAFLRRVLENPRWTMAGGTMRCVGRGTAPHSRRPPHRYRINRFNKFAYNSILVYMARRMTPAMQWRFIPARGRRRGRYENRLPEIVHQPPRTALQAYPNVC
jgi:hypothetical protein